VAVAAAVTGARCKTFVAAATASAAVAETEG